MKRQKSSLKRRKKSSRQPMTKTAYTPAVLSNHHKQHDVLLRRQSALLLHWSTVLLLLLLSLFASFTLLPFLFITTIASVTLFLILFGLCYGYVFYLLLEHIDIIWSHHKIFAAVFIPLVSLMSIISMSVVAENIASILFLKSALPPLYAGLIYLGAFIFPYLLFTFLRLFSKK